MSPDHAELYHPKRSDRSPIAHDDASLHVVLWAIWALVVVGTALWNWYADYAASRPLNLMGMAVYTLLAGIVGLLVITLLEQWFNPRRFVD
ncbi:MAG TPA: hypothetical protein PKK15_14835 [Kouleothrix sp.]|uniref:hypothetical protein n=1 Tax=Kouleothrix sp. TaxID=2779161 RepID=UPI002C48D731|nr:hypothetical protein [Kouleothrix sp.]